VSQHKDMKEIIDIIKGHLKVSDKKVFDKEVAKAIEVSQSELAMYKNRNAIPYEKLLAYCHKNKLSCDEVFFKKTFNLCKTERGTFFIESLEDKKWCYSRTDSCKDISECIEIFKDCEDFGATINNFCSREKYHLSNEVAFTFSDIGEIKNISI
jgi:hypothetical protein